MVPHLPLVLVEVVVVDGRLLHLGVVQVAPLLDLVLFEVGVALLVVAVALGERVVVYDYIVRVPLLLRAGSHAVSVLVSLAAAS